MENGIDMTSFASDYSEPVARLLDLGRPNGHRNPDEWDDYLSEHGIDHVHVDELLKMLMDTGLSRDPEWWGPNHAWRSLAQLKAVNATRQMLDSLKFGGDFAWEEIPIAIGFFGAEAIPAIKEFLSDAESAEHRPGGISALAQIGIRHPEHRLNCIDIVVDAAMGQESDHQELCRIFAISALLEMEAVEAISSIRDAFGRNAVDLTHAGDIEDVEIRMGLRKKRETPLRNYMAEKFPILADLSEKIRQIEERRTKRRPSLSNHVGRNDPCPCGSGKKYKKCCLGGK
jgi:hypothetical protein